MFSHHQRVVVYLMAALSLLPLLHVHSLDTGAVDCTACIQQSYAMVAEPITVSEDPRVEFPEALGTALLSEQTVARPADPRAPPV